MLYTQENVRAGLRVRDGKRRFFLAPEDRLTPEARDWLRSEGIELIDGAETPPQRYVTPDGGSFSQKPEQMTQLAGELLVHKLHPRIAFRGKLDTLEAELLLAQQAAQGRGALAAALRELLDCVRSLVRADVLNAPLAPLHLCGLDADALREHSHHPAKYYGQPHFMPEAADGPAMLQLNRVRTAVRETELAACRAFSDREGLLTRPDIVTALNRLSSLCWILMIRLKAGAFPCDGGDTPPCRAERGRA